MNPQVHYHFNACADKVQIAFLSLLVLLFFSCAKDPKEPELKNNVPESKNYEAGLTIGPNEISVEEGDKVVLTLNLTQEVSKAFPIHLKIESDTVVNYIDDEDYEALFEYSNDNGVSWKKAEGANAEFAAENRSLKIRLNTIDDDLLEVHEKFYILVTPNAVTPLILDAPKQAVIEVKVQDNEEEIVSKEQWLKPPLGPVSLTYRTNSDYTEFKLIKINRNPTIRAEKEMIDEWIKEGFSVPFQSQLKKLYTDAPHHIDEIGINFRDSAAYAEEITSEGYYKGWTLIFQLLSSYFDQITVDNEDGTFYYDYIRNESFEIIEDYGVDVSIHEYGHALTLHSNDLFYEIVDGQPFSPQPCPGLSSYFGCHKENRFFTKFITEFYTDPMEVEPRSKELNEPQFVSEYASAHIVEDMAESFVYYLCQEKIPTPTENSSGALRKIHLFTQFPEIEAYKQKVRASIALPSHFQEYNE